jgi:hypothetical protein
VLGSVPFPPESRQRPRNLDVFAGPSLLQPLQHQLEAPVVGIPGGAKVGGQGAPLPWGGAEGEPVGLDHRAHRGTS